MNRKFSLIIAFLLSFAHISIFSQVSAKLTSSEQNSENSNFSAAEINIKYYDRTVYYSGNSSDNPIYVRVTIINNGSETLRFKFAEDRMFSLDFIGYNFKNKQLPLTDFLVRKRTTNQTVYYREISLEKGEEYSFVENLRDYLQIDEPSIYYIEAKFYPELYKNKNTASSSNRLSLEIRPNPAAAASSAIPVESKTSVILQPREISPDKVIEQTIIARQKSLWDQFFLYLDLEEMIKHDPVRSRKYSISSAQERIEIINAYKADLMLSRIDSDIVAIPLKFKVETTTYSQSEGSVKVLEWFNNGTFLEKKRYTYYVRQRDGIWQIFDYSVDNLGTE